MQFTKSRKIIQNDDETIILVNCYCFYTYTKNYKKMFVAQANPNICPCIFKHLKYTHTVC